MGVRVVNIGALDRARLRLLFAWRKLQDPEDLLLEWRRILEEDNRRRAMAGLDCNDEAMAPTRREIELTANRDEVIQLKRLERTLRGEMKEANRRLKPAYRQNVTREMQDLEAFMEMAGGAKTRRVRDPILRELKAEYREAKRAAGRERIYRGEARVINRQIKQVERKVARRMAAGRLLGTGPPLAPNRDQSRIVRLARSRHRNLAPGRWVAELGWDSFDSLDGRPILVFHQRGIPSRRGPIVRDVLSHPSPAAADRARVALRRWARTLAKAT